MSNRMSISLEKELDDAVEEYKYRNRDRLKTKNKAINELLALGMESLMEQIEQKNKAPTEEESAEALYTMLHYQLGDLPTPEEVEGFNQVLPIICRGIKGLGRT